MHSTEGLIVKGLNSNLLSTPASPTSRHDRILWEKEVKEQFPKVFQGLGVLGEEYRIKLEENVTP